MNISASLREHAINYGQKTAVTVNDASVDFATLYRLTDRLASRLKEAGIVKGNTVAVTLPNSLEFVITYFAVLKLGAIFMGLDPRLTEGELRGLFADGRPRAWIADGRVMNEDLSRDFGVSTLPLAIGSAFLNSYDGTFPLRMEATPVSEEDPGVLLYTSGSTGKPKGVLLPVRTFSVFPEFCENFFEKGFASEAFGVSIPMCHIGGPIYCNLLALKGVPLTIVEPFRPDRFLLAIQKHRITGFHSVPPILMALLQAQLKMRLDLPSLLWIAPMGMSVPVSLMEMLSNAFPGAHIIQGYGLTETAGPIVCTPIKDPLWQLGSIGRPMVSVCTIDIEGTEGETLSPG
jgi:long-chain acyl-CoA synthetase